MLIATTIANGLFWGLIAAVIVAFLQLLYRRKRVLVLEHQAGIYFRRGQFSGVKGPGSYVIRIDREQIKPVDLRRTPFSFDRVQFRDRNGSEAVISLAVDLWILDPVLTVMASSNAAQDAASAIQGTLHQMLPNSDVESIAAGRDRFASELGAAVEPALRKLGVAVDLEITEVGFVASPRGA